MSGGARFEIESAGRFRLPVVRRGPTNSPPLIMLQPLFEEQNRCRRLLADLGGALAARGIASALPDLPRTGDHEDLAPVDFALLAEAAAALCAVCDGDCWLLGMRGGCFLAGKAAAHGLYALQPPSSGERLITDLYRAHRVAEQERTGTPVSRNSVEELWKRGETVRLAGYDIAPELAARLRTAQIASNMPVERRAIAAGSGDFAGPPVWRQAEPVRALSLAGEIADDIASWTRP